MSNASRYRYGETNPIIAAVQTGVAVDIGDLLVWDPDHGAAPVATQADLGDLPSNQNQFGQTFLGVALESCPTGSDKPIRVATTGVFEVDCTSDQYALGELLGGCGNAVDGHLENQKVASVSDYPSAIGRNIQAQSSAVTKLLVDIRSAVMQGGVQPNYNQQRAVLDNTYAQI